MPFERWIREPIEALRQLWADASGSRGHRRTRARFIIWCFTGGFITGVPLAWLLYSLTHGGI